MELIKIEIENYKSITKPVYLNFQKGLPTVLIGKNGSGKSNVLEALEHIASTNSTFYGRYSAGELRYKVHICLDKDEFAKLFPCEEYSEEKASFTACSSAKENLRIDTIESKSIVPLLKKELVDIRAVADELIAAIDDYERTLQKIACEDWDALSLRGYEIIDGKGNTTNFGVIKWDVLHFIEQVKQVANTYDNGMQSENVFVFEHYLYGMKMLFSFDDVSIPFELRYQKPALAPFEQKFITINETAIKREITKINKKTEAVRKKIDELIFKLKSQSERLMDIETCGAITGFLRKVRHIFGGKCGYLLNESNQVLFKDPRREYDNRYNDPSHIIFEAYAKANNKSELLNDKELKLSDKECKSFEAWLNSNRPEFDDGMYKSITVSLDEKSKPVINLAENNGQIVSLDQTSAGRRWYFTYYFVKHTLTEGDTFIIDEPASMLHPSAQKEILKDLLDLSRKGIRVIYSTHSPYLIPQEWNCVGFVSMEDGTNVSYVDTKFEGRTRLKSVIGDIFDLESVVVEFQKNPQKIAENCYQVIKEKDKSLEKAATELNLSVETIKSWHRTGVHFRSPRLENVFAVATYTGIFIKDLLK